MAKSNYERNIGGVTFHFFQIRNILKKEKGLREKISGVREGYPEALAAVLGLKLAQRFQHGAVNQRRRDRAQEDRREAQQNQATIGKCDAPMEEWE